MYKIFRIIECRTNGCEQQGERTEFVKEVDSLDEAFDATNDGKFFHRVAEELDESGDFHEEFLVGFVLERPGEDHWLIRPEVDTLGVCLVIETYTQWPKKDQSGYYRLKA